MGSILEAFAQNRLQTGPQHFRKGSEYEKALNALKAAGDRLNAALGEENKRLAAEFADAQADLAAIEATGRFLYGYRLGVRMTMEVFAGQDGLTTGGE